MVKRVTVLINLFRRKYGVYPVISPRQILFGKKFKTPLFKIGKLVMAYNVTSSNKTIDPRAFFALYIGPNDSGNGHAAFKLTMKRLATILKCKPKPMAKDVVKVFDDLDDKGVIYLNDIFGDIEDIVNDGVQHEQYNH